MLISKKVLQPSGEGSKKKIAQLHLHSPFLLMLYHALLACGCPLCFSRKLCFPTEQHCHSSLAAVCCDPNYSSCTPEIASCLWERSAMADCFMSALSAVEVSKHALPDCSLPFSSSGIISQEALHYLPTSLPQGRRQHLHRPVTLHTSNPGESCVWVKFP